MKPSKSYMSQPMSQEAQQQPLRALVLLEDLPASQIAVIEAAVAACRIDARLYQKAGDLVRELDSRGADLVLLSAQGPRAAEMCASVRRIVGKQAVVIGIGRQVDGLAFGEFVGWGGDDLVEADAGRSLGVRLRAIRNDIVRAGAARTIPRQREDGRFLVVAPSTSEVVESARVIEQAGHHAVVVDSAEDAVTRLAVGRDIRVVVDARVPRALAFVDHALKQNSCTGVVLACPPQQLGQLAARYEEFSDRLIVLDCCSPADTVLLAANQLKSLGRNRRTTERLHYSTMVSFREAGSDVDQLGCTYNVSAGGIYIRTTAMPAGDRVWLEIVPPGSMERVRLEARVAWRTPVTRDPSSPFPVGIGVEITDGTKRCLAGWLEGYRRLQSKLDVQSKPDVVATVDVAAKADVAATVDAAATVEVVVKADQPGLPEAPPPPLMSVAPISEASLAALDPTCRPTVRPPSALRRRAHVWSSMTSGPSASHLSGQAVPLQKTAQVAAVDAGPA